LERTPSSKKSFPASPGKPFPAGKVCSVLERAADRESQVDRRVEQQAGRNLFLPEYFMEIREPSSAGHQWAAAMSAAVAAIPEHRGGFGSQRARVVTPNAFEERKTNESQSLAEFYHICFAA
jgi:hypothetical protein